MREAAEVLRGLSGRRVLVLCHRSADPDGLASAVVLSEVLSSLGAEASAGAADDISLPARQVVEHFGRRVEVNPRMDFDAVVLVDTSGFGHLGSIGEEMRRFAGLKIVIDHHRPNEETRREVDFHFVFENYPSESELVFDMVREMGLSLTPDQASMLLAGIITDTAHFRLARPETFFRVAELLRAGADYQKVIELLRPPDDRSKRVAVLRAIERAEIRRIHGFHFIFSEVGAFEGDVATIFVRIGADGAFVGSEENGKVRLSMRANDQFVAETGIHLGEVAEELGRLFNGSGGGHPAAASMIGEGRLTDLKRSLFNLLQSRLARYALGKGQ
jgi:nanoRNase/pAp phosphatase (c-di-AMP/oligoRNAs hydrolase)